VAQPRLLLCSTLAEGVVHANPCWQGYQGAKEGRNRAEMEESMAHQHEAEPENDGCHYDMILS